MYVELSHTNQEEFNNTINNLPNPDKITLVTIKYSFIADLKCISKLCNLEKLFLKYNDISDISPLSNLKKLKILNLIGNIISDVEPLSDLVNLKCLDLRQNDISDIRPLRKLVKLEDLYLNDNYISDVESLSTLVNLEVIYYENKISNLTPLKHMYTLRKISDTLDIDDWDVLDYNIQKTIEGNKYQFILLESTLPKNYRCPLNNLRERGILGL